MVAVPVRGVVPVFAATVSVTLPLPLPLAGDTAIHPALELAVQEQPAAAVTVMACVPPPLPALTVAGDAAYEQVVPLPPNVNGLDRVLRPVPLGPTAATRDS
jgi:hypothetical protein